MSSGEGGGDGERVEAVLERMQTWFRPDAERRRLYGWIAALIFLLVAGVSAWRLPPLTVEWGWVGLVGVLVLVSTVVLAAEYGVAAWLLRLRVDLWEALRVTIVSSVANLLPVPGSLVVRSEALRRRGSGLGPAVGSNIVMGLGWLGVALLVAGGLLYREGRVVVATAFLTCGILVSLVMSIAIGRLREGRRGAATGGVILAVECVYVLVSAARIFAVLMALGMSVSFPQAAALTVASALAAGVGFFPGGLGLREVLSGGLAALVGVAPAVGAFAGVVDRVVALVVRACLAGIVLGLDLGASESRAGPHGEEGPVSGPDDPG